MLNGDRAGARPQAVSIIDRSVKLSDRTAKRIFRYTNNLMPFCKGVKPRPDAPLDTAVADADNLRLPGAIRFQKGQNRMEPAWGASWLWGLSLITLTIAFHAFGVVMIFRVLRRRIRIGTVLGRHTRHPVPQAIALIAGVGLLLMLLHGIEATIWTATYLLLGAVGTEREAMLYSLDSFTTRGASEVLLATRWRLLGALEAADGTLLFGISTAFVFAVFHRVIIHIDGNEEDWRPPRGD